MEMVIQFGENIFLCAVGLIAYSLFAVRNHISDFDRDIFWNANKNFWIWAILCQVVYALMMALYPILESWLAMKLIAVTEAVMGQEILPPEGMANTIVYLLLTWQLSRVANNSVKNPIGKQKTE